ncbi:hypothetical protein SNE40_014632 [Patella caerulea]|uniref:Ubiquitin-like protease family profile domain-containing protein n=1 Tax=Patella caerulea TaxID=87958 RepID=A0AAN8JIE3_PATCE
MANEDAIVLNFNDSLLRASDLEILDGPNWLNDKLIGFCFEYYEREQFNHSADKLSLISPSVTQFIKLAPVEELTVILESLNLPLKQFVFLAVNDNEDSNNVGGTHWSLLVYIRSKQEFHHFDSANHTNEHIAKKLAYRLQPFVHAPRGRMKFIEMDSPQQDNCYDCGIYVISIAEHLCREFCECINDVSLSQVVTTTAVSKKREQLKELIRRVAEEHAS